MVVPSQGWDREWHLLPSGLTGTKGKGKGDYARWGKGEGRGMN